MKPVAVALVSLAGFLFHRSGDREVAESEPEEGGREVAARQLEGTPPIERRAAGGEHREIRAAPGTTVALSLYVESANSAAVLVEQGQFTVQRLD